MRQSGTGAVNVVRMRETTCSNVRTVSFTPIHHDAAKSSNSKSIPRIASASAIFSISLKTLIADKNSSTAAGSLFPLKRALHWVKDQLFTLPLIAANNCWNCSVEKVAIYADSIFTGVIIFKSASLFVVVVFSVAIVEILVLWLYLFIYFFNKDTFEIKTRQTFTLLA